MGGHGGLNILPQKRWNVYNFDNREKVRKDEEAAAKDDQLKREQSRKHDTQLRLHQIRQAKGLTSSSAPPPVEEEVEERSSKHINLFEGIKILDPSSVNVVNKSELVLGNELRRGFKKMKKEALEPPKPVLPEDEKYRLGYGVAGKGVKLPWYMDNKKKDDDVRGGVDNDDDDDDDSEMASRKRRKKSVEELREERLKREAREKERERALLRTKGSSVRNDGGYSTKYTR
ncbi:hypothetical protein CTI12_AA473100 [Artemisia annua]|uniref:CBF1-interacting co-repressor CIR N-terminal domain-containing protein n=1 Tax=Artemisia annua TaxID=35608 RepID=A0A2U1LNV6_ARTAN|nr:hypothetical protein CTI12_AA473100 [Artemisia annua]